MAQTGGWASTFGGQANTTVAPGEVSGIPPITWTATDFDTRLADAEKIAKLRDKRKATLRQLQREHQLLPMPGAGNWNEASLMRSSAGESLYSKSTQKVLANLRFQIKSIDAELKGLELKNPMLAGGSWSGITADDIPAFQQLIVKQEMERGKPEAEAFRVANEAVATWQATQAAAGGTTPTDTTGQETSPLTDDELAQQAKFSNSNLIGMTTEQIIQYYAGERDRGQQAWDADYAAQQAQTERTLNPQSARPVWWDSLGQAGQAAAAQQQAGLAMSPYEQANIGQDAYQFSNPSWAQQQQSSQWEQSFGLQQRQLQMDEAYRQAALAQEMAVAQMEIEQRRRAAAAQAGASVNDTYSQNWRTGLGYVLPKGTTTPPGFGYGGPMQALSQMAGMGSYTPMRIAPSNPPSKEALMRTISEAISRF